MRPTIDYRIPSEKKFHFHTKERKRSGLTSVLIDRRLFKSCIRYSGDGGGGGSDGLKGNKRHFIRKLF